MFIIVAWLVRYISDVFVSLVLPFVSSTMVQKPKDEKTIKPSSTLVRPDPFMQHAFFNLQYAGPIMDKSREIPYEEVNTLQVCILILYSFFSFSFLPCLPRTT